MDTDSGHAPVNSPVTSPVTSTDPDTLGALEARAADAEKRVEVLAERVKDLEARYIAALGELERKEKERVEVIRAREARRAAGDLR
jgi:hypothetical protein